MFIPLTETEKRDFLSQSVNSFIPGYTGHCPTLKFHYGKCYGAKTKEIMQELRNRGVLRTIPKRESYRADDPVEKVVLKPIASKRDQSRDYSLNYTKQRAPKYIIGYTGFIPTLNFRYGKSYGRTADDSFCEFSNRRTQIQQNQDERDRLLRAKSAPRMMPIRNDDEVTHFLKDYGKTNLYKERQISPEDPPISGYTGHIPRVKGNEESLSKRYNTVVKRGLTIVKEERVKRNEMLNAQKKINNIISEVERRNKHNTQI